MARKSRPLSEEQSQAHTNRRIDNQEKDHNLLDSLFDGEDLMEEFWETEGKHYGSI